NLSRRGTRDRPPHRPPLSFFPMSSPPPRSTLFPYTTLFRSQRDRHAVDRVELAGDEPENPRSDGGHDRIVDAVEIGPAWLPVIRSEEHTSELQSRGHLVCRLLLEKKKKTRNTLCRKMHAIHC